MTSLKAGGVEGDRSPARALTLAVAGIAAPEIMTCDSSRAPSASDGSTVDHPTKGEARTRAGQDRGGEQGTATLVDRSAK